MRFKSILTAWLALGSLFVGVVPCSAVLTVSLPVSGTATDSDKLAGVTPTATGLAVVGAANALAGQTALALVPGTNVQQYDAELTALAGLTSAANKGVYFTGAGTAATYDLPSYSRTLLSKTSSAQVRAYLGLADTDDVQFGTLGAIEFTANTISTTSINADNGIVYIGDPNGTPLAISFGTITAGDIGGGVTFSGSAWGDMVQQNAAAVTITGGTIADVTVTGTTISGGAVTGADISGLPVALQVGDGGTGATDAAAARTNLGADDAANLSTGTLAAARGGAGTISGILKANGSGVVAAATAGTDYLAPDGSGAALTALNASNISAGTLAVARGGTGNATGVRTWLQANTNGSITGVDATTYYAGAPTGALTGTPAIRRLYIPTSCTLKKVYGYFVQGAGSAETSTLSIRVNNSSDTTVSSAIVNNATITTFSNASLSLSLTAGDYIEIKWVSPTWVTDPTNVQLVAVLEFQQ